MPLSITSANSVNIGQGTTSGLMGFYGNTQVDQAAAIVAPGTTAATTTTPWGFATSTQADAVALAVANIVAALGSTSGVGLTA